MKPQVFHILYFLLTAVGLAACQPSGSVGSSSASNDPETSMAVASPTVTVTSTGVPTPTNTVTKTPYPSTPVSQRPPDIFNSPIASDPLFSGDETCQLPCWYGLRVGESNVDHIQFALRQALGVSKNYVFIMGEDSQLLGTNSGYINFDWQDGQAGSRELLGIQTYFNPQADILGRLQMSTTVPLYLQHTMPQRVLKELGTPSAVNIRLVPTEVIEIASLNTIFLYSNREGKTDIFLSWSELIPASLTQGNTSKRAATWCLNGSAHQEEQYFLMRVSSSANTEATPSNESSYEPLQQAFGLTPEALYQQVAQEDNTCLSHEF